MIYRCAKCGKEMPTGYPTYIVEVRMKPRRYQPIYDKETKLVDIEVCEKCKDRIIYGNGFPTL